MVFQTVVEDEHKEMEPVRYKEKHTAGSERSLLLEQLMKVAIVGRVVFRFVIQFAQVLLNAGQD